MTDVDKALLIDIAAQDLPWWVQRRPQLGQSLGLRVVLKYGDHEWLRRDRSSEIP